MTAAAGAISAAEFAALMAPLGPFERRPRLAVACSGGADSLALTLLADAWARARGGDAVALIVDHRLRPLSTAEADATAARLAGRGIAARVLALEGLHRGPGLAARARAVRLAALEAEAARDGRLHLLLGHHGADQAETLAMRQEAGSGAAGLAGMSAIRETALLRLLRPLLPVAPGRLRATLHAASLDWVEDPSNADPATLRARLRAAFGDRDGAAVAAAAAHATRFGVARAALERRVAAELAARAAVHPEGVVLLTPGALLPESLAALLCLVAGRIWTPPSAAVARLAAAPGPATLGGARLCPAGRLLPGGWLLLREAAAMAPAVPAADGARWDGRYRLHAPTLPAGLRLSGLGAASSRLRRASPWPAAVLRTLPALWRGEMLAAVPHLGYAEGLDMSRNVVEFAPPAPLAGAPFRPSLPPAQDRPAPEQ